MAIERNDWSAADSLVMAGRTRPSPAVSYDSYWSSALVYAVAAHVAARRGGSREARQHIARATRLRPLLTYALPVVSVQALLGLAHALFAAGRHRGGQGCP